MTKQDKMKIDNLLVRIKQIEDEIERLRLFDNQIEANYNRVFDYGVTNRIMLDEQCRKIGELKAKFEAKSCDFVKTAQKQAKIEAVKEFAEKVKEKALLHCRTINCYECKFIETTIDELLEEYEND